MKRILVTALACVLTFALPLAARVDFTGKWQANLPQSDFGSMGAPDSFERVILEDGLHLVINVTSMENGKRTTGELRFSLDGEEAESTIGGVKVVGFAREIGDHVLVHTTRDWDGMPTKILELWTLSPDGKTLQIDAVVSTGMGDEELRVVFQKQD